MTIEVSPLGTRCQLACTYCADPSTPVLTEDGSWLPIGDITVGNVLWSFDEHRAPGRNRRICRGAVSRAWSFCKTGVRIIYEDGEIVVGADHLMLNHLGRWVPAGRLVGGRSISVLMDPSPTPVETDAYRVGYFVGVSEGDGTIGDYDSGMRTWTRADGSIGASGPYRQYAYRLAMNDTSALERAELFARNLGISLDRRPHHYGDGLTMPSLRARKKAIVQRIAGLLDASRHEDREWVRGWLAGMFDAEGSIASALRISQYDEACRDRLVAAFRLLGFKAVKEEKSVRLLGGYTEILRFHAITRPAILRKLTSSLNGTALRTKNRRVLAVEPCGPIDLVDISVKGAHTYFAAGIPSHNCYQEPVRDADNEGDTEYDMDAMKRTLAEEGYRFSVFGGEPLLVPVEDLAELWRWGDEQFGEQARADGYRANGIQTNGSLLTDKHVQLMKRYDVGVGVSIDGPGELNDARWAGTEEATREATEKSLAALDKLLVMLPKPPSIIVTLHRLNSSTERLPALLDWLRELRGKGLCNLNAHLLERDTPRADELRLDDAEAVAALIALDGLSRETGLRVEPLLDMEALLRQQDQSTSCIWNACDPYTTAAVRGVGGQGERLNCGRTYKDGVKSQKADVPGYERYVALYHTPQAYGGCAGCRFFFACKGNCPGTGEGGDWRAKTEHCAVLMGVFEHLEARMMCEGEVPFSLDPRRQEVERRMVNAWQVGNRIGVLAALEGGNAGEGHGDVPHGDGGHGDVPHGDEHGDSDDPEWCKRTGWEAPE